MTVQWTADQILALAPDAASAKNGRSLATLRKWAALGSSDRAIWGECQGSGKTPYRTQIDLSEPAFRCSCPSRKFPCKHGLGLFLLWTEQPFDRAEPPDWVTEWLTGREQRQEKAANRTVDADAQAKRAGDRQRKITAGIQDLRLWLEDRVRQGLANLPQEPYPFWDAPAARLVDAQAPGLARQVRELATVVHTGNDWIDRLLGQLARLYLLTEGFDRLETLPPQVQADLRTQIGWTIAQEEVLAAPGQADLWLVVGQRTEKEDPL
ncbi:MAG: SWIM zinc finger family protein, partial [Microcoleus sp. SIO2G3]|nr:SWIM zinc finger family protein [Microcoleus sp. SIO2G3]